MFTKSIGRLAATATRRRDAAGVRVHPDAGQVPSPTRHRNPARNAGAALRQIEAEAPLQAAAGYAYSPRTLVGIRERIDRCREDAEAMTRDGFELLVRAEHRIREADDLEHLLWLADITQDAPTPDRPTKLAPLLFRVMTNDGPGDSPQVLGRFATRQLAQAFIDDEPVTDYTEPLYIDGPDEPDAKPWAKTPTEEPEPVDLATLRLPDPDPVLAARMGEQMDRLEREDPDPRPEDERMPEALTAGPAAVPQLQQQRDTETIRLPWGRPAVLDDTRDDLEAVKGVGR